MRDRKKDQKGEHRSRSHDDGKGRGRRKWQSAGKRRADGGAAHLQKAEQRRCQPGLTPEWMKHDRHGEGREGRRGGEGKHGGAAGERDEEADPADGTRTGAILGYPRAWSLPPCAAMNMATADRQ